MRQIVYAGPRLGLYKIVEDYFKNNKGRNMGFFEKVAASFSAGAIGSYIANPFDVALIRMQADNNLPQAERRNYTSVWNAISRIFSEEGIAGLWRGAIPTVARAMMVNVSHLVSYNQSK